MRARWGLLGIAMVIPMMTFGEVKARPQWEGALRACGEKHAQSAMNQCASEVLKKSQEEMAGWIAVSRSRLGESEKKSFDDAQGAWLAFRDQWCGLLTHDSRGGSIHPFAFASCVVGVTHDRMQQLQHLATCGEGDVTCPASPTPRP